MTAGSAPGEAWLFGLIWSLWLKPYTLHPIPFALTVCPAPNAVRLSVLSSIQHPVHPLPTTKNSVIYDLILYRIDQWKHHRSKSQLPV
jgi:hypothetical protein